MDIELIEYPHHDVVDHFIDGLRMVVKRRHWRKNDDAHAGQLEHILQVDVVERRFPHDQDQFAALFQNHIGGAVNEVVALAVGDRGQRTHAARRNYHPAGHERAARDGCALIVGRIVDGGHRLHLVERIGGLVREGARAPFTDYGMCLDAGAVQSLQKADSEDRSGGAGDADDQSG